MKSNLKQLYKVQQILKKKGYLDISRISKEILEYCETSNIPLIDVLKKIQKNEPWEYIKEECEFYNNKFIVNRNTLIPRVETEQIIDIATAFLSNNNDYKYVLDVGTGSGCIIISLIKNLCKKKDINFLATDIDSKTLEIAKKNSVLHKVNRKVSFSKTNLIKDLQINGPSFVIANLPYIPTKTYMGLDKSVVNFESRNSLDGGKDGLKYYRELLNQIKKKLRAYKTTLLIEIKPSTLNNLKRLLKKDLDAQDIKVFKDFRGLNRFILVHLS